MLAAVDDVHHRHGQHMRRYSAEVRPQRHPSRISRGLGHCHTGTENSVRAKRSFVAAAIKCNHRHIDVALILSIHFAKQISDLAVNCINCLGHALAHVAGRVTIAQFHSLMSACRCSGRHRGAAHAAIFQQDIDFDRRVAPGIKNFAAVNVDDSSHVRAPV